MSELMVLVSGVISALVGWFIGKRKSEAETDNVVLKNLEASVNLYREIIQDLKTEIEALNVKILELENKIDILHNENIKLKKLL